MDSIRASVAVVTVAVITISVISGPLVGGLDLTPESWTGSNPGSGNVSVSVKSTPESATLRRISGRDTYRLEVPSATVNVGSVSGRPLIVYKLRLREIGYTRSTILFLNSSRVGQQNIKIEPGTTRISPPVEDTYTGELLILIRSDAGERELYEGNVTVEVTR